MKNNIMILLFALSLLSCNNEITSKPNFEFPKYKVSESEFTKKLTDIDSLLTENVYESKKTFFSKTSENQLIIKVYYNDNKNLEETFVQNQLQLIKENALNEIMNIGKNDVLIIKMFQNNLEIKSLEVKLK